MSESFAQPDDFGDLHASELHSSLGESLGAQAGDAFMGGSRTLYRGAQYLAAQSGAPQLNEAGAGMGEGAGFVDPALTSIAPGPEVPIADAKARVKQEGLEDHLKLPDQPTIRPAVLDLMVADAHERQQYEAAVNRGPHGFLPGALGFATGIGAGMIDPVNIAAFSIPVLGEARYGQILARAGDSFVSRAAIKTGVGAAQGAVGGAALVPADWWLKTQDGQDYTFADALKSVALSAGMGAAFHAAGGFAGDLYRTGRGRPLAGTIEDLRTRALAGDAHAADLVEQFGGAGTHLPEQTFEPTGVDLDAVPGIGPAENNAPAAVSEARFPPHPAEVLADLPQGAQEDVVRSAVADVINGEPVHAGELLQEAAKDDPRIAETIEAWHGSPHDFEQFDLSKVGTGEGAQSYGHGLYFAENERVARNYQRSTSDKAFINKVAELYDEGFSPSNAWDEIKDHWKEFSPAEQRLMTALEKDDWLGFDYPHQAVSAALHDLKSFEVSPETVEAARAMGSIYKVHIAAHKEHFLDWDRPLKDQRELLEKFRQIVSPDLRQAFDANVEHGISGANAYHNYVGAGRGGEAASEALRDAGIPGIKYHDQGSRNGDSAKLEHSIAAVQKQIADVEAHVALNRNNPSVLPAFFERQEQDLAQLRATLDRYKARLAELGKPTRNYVVFDDKLVRITHKNGEEVGLDQAKAEQAAAAAEGVAAFPGRSAEARNKAAATPVQAVRGPRARPEDTWSLNEFLASRGGINPDDPLIADLRGSIGKSNKFIPGFGHLSRKGGMGPERAREAAVEAGYIHDAGDVTGRAAQTNVSTLLDAMDDELRGKRVYPHGRLPEMTKAELERMAEHEASVKETAEHDLRQALGEIGEKIDDMPAARRARVLEIMTRERVHDPLEAFERAVMEEDHNAAEAGEFEPNAEKIAGWNADDVGTAPGEGGATAQEQLAAGGGDRAGPRSGGANDRASPLQAAGARVDWQALARKPQDDEELIEASNEAARTETPASAESPERAVSAAERAAADADKLLDDILPKLTDEEREIFQKALDQVDYDKKLRETVVRDGAACLAGAAIAGLETAA